MRDPLLVLVGLAAGLAGQTITVTPSAETVSTGTSRQFTANATVTWSVNGVGGGAASARSSLWIGLSAEYRVTRALLAQVGMDPGSAPCTQLGTNGFPRLQFGFDLFREWIF